MVFPFFFLPFPFSQVIKSDVGGYGELDNTGDEKTHGKNYTVPKFHILSRDAELKQVQRKKGTGMVYAADMKNIPPISV